MQYFNGRATMIRQERLYVSTDFVYLNVFLYRHILTDVTPPVFTSCPSDIHASINVSSTVLVNWTEPVALDNGDLAPQVTSVPPGIRPPHNFNKTTLVVYTARDASGNKKECSFKVVLEGECELDFATCIWGIMPDWFPNCFWLCPHYGLLSVVVKG